MIWKETKKILTVMLSSCSRPRVRFSAFTDIRSRDRLPQGKPMEVQKALQ